MSLTLAIIIVILADVALLAGLSYVMSRAKLLTPHASRHDASPAAQATVTHRRHAHAPARRSAPRNTPARRAGSFAAEA